MIGNRYQGKSENVTLERNNRQQRHWTAALRRLSIVAPKSLTMIERRVALFASGIPSFPEDASAWMTS